MSLTVGLLILIHKVVRITSYQLPIWIFACAGVVFLWKRRSSNIDRLFMFGFLFFAFLAICPGFYFRAHYFIIILPPIALFAGFAVRESTNLVLARTSSWLHHAVPIILLAALISYGLYKERLYLFTLSPKEVSQDTYDINPFPESILIARYLKAHTTLNDKIAVLGSEPQIYFYTNRLSATGHIYMYGLMENHPNAEKMQLEMIKEIEASRPLYIVKVCILKSWPVNSDSPKNLIQWSNTYINQNYKLVGITDRSGGNTNYVWDNMVTKYVPKSDSSIYIYKRTGKLNMPLPKTLIRNRFKIEHILYQNELIHDSGIYDHSWFRASRIGTFTRCNSGSV